MNGWWVAGILGFILVVCLAIYFRDLWQMTFRG